MNETPSFITINTCAEILNVHPDTIKRAVRSGRLKAYKVGMYRYRILYSNFIEYLKSLRYSPNMPQMKDNIKNAIEITQNPVTS